jgi:hypothetical protein
MKAEKIKRRNFEMTGHLYQDWPVYFLLGVVIIFFGYVIIKGNMPEKKDNQGQNKSSGTK